MAKKKTTKKTDPAIKPKAPAFLKKDLEAVANELSKVMEFEELIPTGKKATIAMLISDIKEAALELEKEDVISDETLAVLAGLEATLPWDITVDAKEELEEPETEVKEEQKTEMPPNLVDKKGDNKSNNKSDKKPDKKKDEFGFPIGSQSNLFVNTIKEKPMTMAEIKKEKWNAKGGTYYSVWKRLQELKVGMKTADGKMSIPK